MKVNEIKVSYKKKKRSVKICSSEDAYKILRPFFEDEMELRESFYVLYLDSAQNALGVLRISTGGVRGTVFDPKIAFSTGCIMLASALILSHNHPSGNKQPSKADIEITKNAITAGKLLEINVKDNLIITEYGYLSMADENILTFP